MNEHTFNQNGRMVTISRDRGNEIPTLAPAFYLVKHHPEIGFFLSVQDPLTLPAKTYGSNTSRSQRVLNTYQARKGVNTGVLLTGNKGSGKTLLAKDICVKAVNEQGYPVILLETPFSGASFNEFMNHIKQPCVVLIDEFEKKYIETEDQNNLLSLLDGTGGTDKLFILTSNSAQVSEFMLSRPSRLFYHWSYGKLGEEVLMGYCEDHLKEKKHLDNIKTLLSVSTDISFDVMQSVVEELNRYPEEDFIDLLTNMNINLGDALNRRYIFCGARLDAEELTFSNGYQNNVNIVDFVAGNTRINAPVQIQQWALMKELRDNFSTHETFWYNYNLDTQVTSGEVSEAYAEDNMDETLEFCLKFDSRTDFFNTEEIILNREVNGKQLRLSFKALTQDPMEVHFRKLFK